MIFKTVPSQKKTSFLIFFPLLLLALGLATSPGCSSGTTESKDEISQVDRQWEELKEEADKSTNYNQTLVKLKAYLYKVKDGDRREQIQTWIKKLEIKKKRALARSFDSFMDQVDRYLERGQVEKALEKLKRVPPALRQGQYVEKIVEKRKKLSSQMGIYTHTSRLLQKAKKLSQYQRYDVALAILETFDYLPGNKPTELKEKVSSLEREINRKRDLFEEERKKLAKLPWHRVLNERDLHNWHYNPAGRKYWDIAKYILKGVGSGYGQNSSWAIVKTVAKDSEGYDSYDGEYLKDYICEFQFQITKGSGFDFWSRVKPDEQKVTSISINTNKFKPQIWYSIRAVVKGNNVRLLCPTNLFEAEATTTSPMGSFGFRLKPDTTLKIREVKVKVLSYESE